MVIMASGIARGPVRTTTTTAAMESRKMTVILQLGSLRNHDGDAEDNAGYKVNLYFTYESRGILKSFSLFLTV